VLIRIQICSVWLIICFILNYVVWYWADVDWVLSKYIYCGGGNVK